MPASERGWPQTAWRQVGGVSAVDLQGRITVGEGNIRLRLVVASLLEKGNKRILLNLRGVGYIDSSGLGELVRTHTTLLRHGGEMKLSNLGPKREERLRATRFDKVLYVYEDEDNAAVV